MSEYIITKIREGEYDVFNEENHTRYAVDTRKGECNCPHFYFRLRRSGGKCKHMGMIKEKGAWNE